MLFFFVRFRQHRDLPSFPTRRSSDLDGLRCDWIKHDLDVADSNGIKRPECVGDLFGRASDALRGALALRAGLSKRSDRKSTRLNSSHQIISYAVFCLKKKKKKQD